jgi:tetratricopeptide (TPR) repeat protein
LPISTILVSALATEDRTARAGRPVVIAVFQGVPMSRTQDEARKEVMHLLERERWSEAATHLECLRDDPEVATGDRLWALDNLGYAYYRLGRPQDALACCRAALELNPGHAYAYKGQGVCLAQLGRLDDGVTSLLKAISIEPNFFDAYHDLAVVLLQGGYPEKARPWAQRAYQLDPVRGEALVRRFK